MSDPTKANQSVTKVLQIIETLANAGEPMRLIEISHAVEMPSSTVLRMITSLMEYGYAYQDSRTQRYSLTLRFAGIGNRILERFDIRTVVHPFLEQLVQVTGETACLAVEQEMQGIYLDVVHNTDSLINIRQAVGKAAPMHATGSGKLLLTQYTPEELQRYVELRGLPAYTDYTITSMTALEKALEKARTLGYALDDQECELGVRCLAMPLYDYQKRVIATVCVTGPVSRMSYQRLEALNGILREITAGINAKLAFAG